MKWIYRGLTLLLLAVAIGLPFFIDNKQGEPMLSLPSTQDLLPQQATSANTRTVYKWQDQHGVWHYGDTPPSEHGKGFDRIELRTDTNLIQGLKPAEKKPAEATATPEPTPTGKAPAMTDSNEDLMSLDRLKNVMNDAKAARDMMEQRNDQLKQLTGER